MAFYRKKERTMGSKSNVAAAAIGKTTTLREEMEDLATQAGLMMIPELEFDHCIYQLSPENFTNDPATQMTEIYQRCASFLNLPDRPNLGVTCIVSPRWFFLAILTQPYATAPNGNPIYLDGFDFSGLVSLQTTG